MPSLLFLGSETYTGLPLTAGSLLILLGLSLLYWELCGYCSEPLWFLLSKYGCLPGFRIELLIRKGGKEKGSLISWSVSCLSSSSSNFSFVVVLALLILLELLPLNWFPKWSLPLSSSSSVLMSVRCIGVMVAISCINCVMLLHYLYGNTQILSIIQSPS